MKKLLIILFVVLLSTPYNSKAQDTIKVKQTAQLLADAFIKQDYDTFLNYMYPKVITLGGGREKTKTIIIDAMNEIKSEGLTFRSVTLGPVSKIYKAGTELHCKIDQYLKLNVEGGYLSSISPLLGISTDGGETWTFVSAGDLNEKKIKTLFPDFNHELVLENSSVPIFHEEK